jgi:hypothetical protein
MADLIFPERNVTAVPQLQLREFDLRECANAVRYGEERDKRAEENGVVFPS